MGDSTSDTYLDGNLEIKCWESEHLKWALMVGLPSLVFWGLGLPIGAIWMLRRNQEKLHLDNMKAKFGFLYEGYFTKSYYWESIVFYRKMILILISVFMANSDAQVTVIFEPFYTSSNLLPQGAIVIGISIGNYLLQIKVNPYLTDVLNEMERRSLVASAITIYCGLFYLSDDLGSAIKMCFFAGLLIANIYFFVYFAIEFIKAKSEELLKIKIVEKLFGRCLRFLVKFDWSFSRKSAKVARAPINKGTDNTPREDSIIRVFNISSENLTKKKPPSSIFRKMKRTEDWNLEKQDPDAPSGFLSFERKSIGTFSSNPFLLSSPETGPQEILRGEKVTSNDNFGIHRSKTLDKPAEEENIESSYPIKRAGSLKNSQSNLSDRTVKLREQYKKQVTKKHEDSPDGKTVEGLLEEYQESNKVVEEAHIQEEVPSPLINIQLVPEDRKSDIIEVELERSSNNLLDFKAENSPTASLSEDVVQVQDLDNNNNVLNIPGYMKPLNRGYKRPKSRQKVEEFVFGLPDDENQNDS